MDLASLDFDSFMLLPGVKNGKVGMLRAPKGPKSMCMWNIACTKEGCAFAHPTRIVATNGSTKSPASPPSVSPTSPHMSPRASPRMSPRLSPDSSPRSSSHNFTHRHLPPRHAGSRSSHSSPTLRASAKSFVAHSHFSNSKARQRTQHGQLHPHQQHARVTVSHRDNPSHQQVQPRQVHILKNNHPHNQWSNHQNHRYQPQPQIQVVHHHHQQHQQRPVSYRDYDPDFRPHVQHKIRHITSTHQQPYYQQEDASSPKHGFAQGYPADNAYPAMPMHLVHYDALPTAA